MVFLYSHWRSLPLSLRIQIATKFGIAKVGSTHVVDNRIESDGYNIEDVERALNVDAVQSFTGSESTDFQVLWDALLTKIEGRVPPEEVAALVSAPVIFNAATIEPLPEKPFCEFCDSKGKRHKKECTRPQ